MIVVEQSEARKTQPNYDSNVAAATSSTPLIPAESPPAYTPREGPSPSSSSAPPYHNPPSPPVTQKRQPGRAANLRFAKALLFAFGGYVAIASLIKFIIVAVDISLHDVRWPRREDGHPEPEDGRVIRCIKGDDRPWPPGPHVQSLSFSIPLNSSAIYVLARGQQTNGRIMVVPHETDVSDEITVDIAAEYREPDASRGTTMCLMERKKGERGVAIFSPKHLIWTNRRTDVEITVRIPHQPATPVLELPVLEIVAPNFQVTLPSADEFVNFHDLMIHTSNMPVTIGSVKATNIDIQTSNVDIHGTFITKSSLSLATSNARIKANILLENDSTSGKEPSVHATTTGGSLTDAIPSLSNTEAPRYTIRATTTNAELNLAFLRYSGSSHPSSTPVLDIIGSTSNGPAELLLQPSFEGDFDISTSPAYQADFSSRYTPDNDPLGLGRQHHIDFMTSIKSRQRGRVYWGDLDPGRELSRVELSTSNGPAYVSSDLASTRLAHERVY